MILFNFATFPSLLDTGLVDSSDSVKCHHLRDQSDNDFLINIPRQSSDEDKTFAYDIND